VSDQIVLVERVVMAWLVRLGVHASHLAGYMYSPGWTHTEQLSKIGRGQFVVRYRDLSEAED